MPLLSRYHILVLWKFLKVLIHFFFICLRVLINTSDSYEHSFCLLCFHEQKIVYIYMYNAIQIYLDSSTGV